ncbi:hypothetical protein C1Y40_01128 [Mycobacterium talmoniae]|uniref:GmrSD restriction endonucleases C-terminal domain-containing protein n=1 Tax=Mycobacterium talmoniae TaxID=1858794 RepID=A0A2S8BPU4_9MYCO|nr:hypothetical protein C1Y40_01128 [Mycobacterium talmoniae]
MIPHPHRPRFLAAAAVVGAVSLTGLLIVDHGWVTPVATSSAAPAGGADNEALAALDSLPIKGRAPKTGYDRGLFGEAWSDDVTVADGHNGCDTRNDILRRDLVDVQLKPGTNGCVVLSGTLHDPYTGTVIAFQRGRGTSRAVQIDHIVALSDAWQKGAQGWDEATRRNFANDPANLQATDGPINEQKEDGDAATWLPPNKSYRCTYVTRIVTVKAAYGLWVTQAEHDAIARILADGLPRGRGRNPPSRPHRWRPRAGGGRCRGLLPELHGRHGRRGRPAASRRTGVSPRTGRRPGRHRLRVAPVGPNPVTGR